MLGIEKYDVAKTIYFKNSNKWDAAADILQNQYQLSLFEERTRRSQDVKDMYLCHGHHYDNRVIT